jgi:UDP-N-acetylmuramoyl-tripeptide--D-alanyl-D-alanine ligase
LVSDPAKGGNLGPMLVVDDVLGGMRALAEASRERSQARRIAVTGSVGKTSTKEALAVCLAASGKTHASAKSYNNHLGVPLTLARMPESARFGVFEMGMNHRGEILPLAQLVQPHIAIVTWIAPAHLEALGSLTEIAEEKADIFTPLAADGVAIVPNEAPEALTLIARAQERAGSVVKFGREAGCEARLLNFTMLDDHSVAEADILGRQLRYRIGAPGAHWGLNSVAALAAADLAGADLHAAAHALARFEPPEGRGRSASIRAPFGAFTLLDDSYNANPASVAAAFQSLAARSPSQGGRRIAALGDMLELGPDEAQFHAGLAEPVSSAADLVYCAGPRMRALWDALPINRRGVYAETADLLAPSLIESLQNGDVVLIKGSNGSKMFRVAEALKRLAVATE